MGASLTTVNALTKEIYGPRVVDQLEHSNKLTSRMEKTSRGTSSEVGGKYVTFPLKVRRNHGIGYRNELEQLQAPGQQGWTNVRVGLRYGYGRVHMSGQTFELVNENYQAFASAMTEEMEGLRRDIAKDTNRILWGDQTGKISGLAAGTGTTLTVTDGMRHISQDMRIDIIDASALPTITYIAQNRTITNYNKSAGTFTINGASVTVADGDFIVRTGNFMKEPHGITSLVNNSTAPLFNLSSNDEPLWQSEVDNTGGAISESRMITMCDRIADNGGRPSVIWTDLPTRRAYFQLLTTQRRHTNTKDFGGGFTGLTFSYDDDIPVMTDVDAPAGKMWFLSEDDFKIYRHKTWHWQDRDGSIWKWVNNYDAWEALMKQYWEFAIERRNTQGVMTGITPG